MHSPKTPLHAPRARGLGALGAGLRTELFIAWRILRPHRRRSAFVITAISVVGIIIGVWALIVVSGVSGGFQDAFRQRILGLYPHLLVLERAGDFQDWREIAEKVRGTEGVTGASASTFNEMMAAVGDRRSGIAVRGVDTEHAASVSQLDQALLEGRLADLDERPIATLEGDRLKLSGAVEDTRWLVAVGAGGVTVARDLEARPDFGSSRIRLVHLDGSGGPLRLELADVDEVSSAVRPGDSTRAVEVEPGTYEARVLSEAGELLATRPVELAADGGLALVVLPGDAGGPGLRLMALSDPPVRPAGSADAPNDARFRVIHASAEVGPVRVATGEGGTDLATVAPGEVSADVSVPGRLPRILLGVDLRKRLGADKGSVVTLVSPLRGIDNRELGPFGMAPSSARFEVAGWYRSGFHEYDVRLAMVDLFAAQRFIRRGDVVQWIDVRMDDDFRVAERTEQVRRRIEPYGFIDFMAATQALDARLDRLASGDVRGFPMEAPTDAVDLLVNTATAVQLLGRQGVDFGYRERYKLIDWEEMNHNLLSALKLQKVVITVIFLIIIAVAAFNVVGSQVMLIHDKRAEISILESMGVTRAGISRIFLLQGLLVSGIGTSVGLVLGLGLSGLIEAVGFGLDPEVYLISELPVRIDVAESVAVALLALLFTCLVTLYSAVRASQVTPVQGLREID
jgi:ABC-type lipoprotein release transport system permease subunit